MGINLEKINENTEPTDDKTNWVYIIVGIIILITLLLLTN